MALLGAQLVVTLVVISIIQKVGPHFSLARWLLCSTGLVRYLYPTDSELKQSAKIKNTPKDKHKKGHWLNGKGGGDHQTKETFHIPRNLDVRLDKAKVTRLDVVHLQYYMEYQWLVDFTIYSLIVYAFTEVYQVWFTLQEEINLSILWCSLVLLFSVKQLMSLTLQYFKDEQSVGERSTCIVMAFTYLVLSMVILIVDENTLELGLEEAYQSFNQGASKFLTTQGLSSVGPASKVVLKFFLALWCGILGALLTFPGLRIARMHWDLLKYYRDSKMKQVLLNSAFAMPFILIILWIKPISRTYLTVRIFSGMEEPLLKPHVFESLRIILILLTVAIKMILMPWYLQAYLDMAYNRIEAQKKEAGRITNVEYQKKIAAVFYYLCVVTLQYIAPLILCLCFTLMYKTLGEYSWSGLWVKPPEPPECPLSPSGNSIDPFTTNGESGEFARSATEFHLALDNLKSVFSAQVFRGLLGFSTWWCCFLYFATTSIGLIYQSYFSNV